MAQSLSNILVHLIFSTKGRYPFLADGKQRAAMHRYLAAVSARLGCPIICVGGAADHVHCLARHGRTIAVAEWVKELKRTSSQWAKTQAASLRGFQWQAGYGAFSVSQSLSGRVGRYIAQQPEHHQRVDFQTEFRKLLQAHGVEYDERYVWD
jgi:putative transposase